MSMELSSRQKTCGKGHGIQEGPVGEMTGLHCQLPALSLHLASLPLPPPPAPRQSLGPALSPLAPPLSWLYPALEPRPIPRPRPNSGLRPLPGLHPIS